MSLRSGKRGGLSRATATVVFAGTLLMYVGLTAIPAAAATTCAPNGTYPTQIDLSVATDSTVDVFRYTAPSTTLFTESFDAIPAGTLPAGWFDVNVAGTNVDWQSQAFTFTGSSGPNSAWVGEVATASQNALWSPPIAIPAAGGTLTFRHRIDSESGFDGGQVQYRVGAGAWTEIIAAGGVFTAGAYNDTDVDGIAAGADGWSGGPTNRTTTITLPPSAANSTIQLRWFFGTDTTVAGNGWWIDNVAVASTAGVDSLFAYTHGSGPAWPGIACAAYANVDYVNITAPGNGSEAVNVLWSDGNAPGYGLMSNSNFSVNLGLGTDSLNLVSGGFSFPGGPTVADPNTPDAFRLGSAAGVGLVVDLDAANTSGDLRIEDAENFGIQTGGGDDTVDADGSTNIGATSTIAINTADDIPAAPDPYAGNFTFDAGNGNDTLGSGNGNEVYLGGPDADFVDYSQSAAGVIVDLGAGTGTGMGSDTLSDVQRVDGSAFDDQLTGSGLDNILNGLAGDDVISGLAGVDAINGGNGDDALDGGDGNDTVNGDADDDSLVGGAGNDVINGGTGDDYVDEGAAKTGADVISGGGDTGVLTGGGDEVDYSARTRDVLISLNAVADDGEPLELVLGTTIPAEGDNVGGDVEIFATGSGNDTLVTDGSDEAIFTDGGNDSITSGGGIDWVQPGAGDDTVDTGTGSDWVDYSDAPGPDGIVVDTNANPDTITGHGSDTVANAENFNGSNFDDTFHDNVLTSNAYIGNGGDDYFDQGGPSPVADADVWDGGAGIDTVDFGARTEDVLVDLTGVLASGEGAEADATDGKVENAITGSGNDQVIGNVYDNHVTPGDGNDNVTGAAGNDHFMMGAAPDGADFFGGGDGTDTADYTGRTGDVRVDLSGGGNQGEAGEGDNFDGTLENAMTGSGNDTVFGNGLANILDTGAGDDTLGGEGGNDQLLAGDGIDMATFASNVANAGINVNLGQGNANGGGQGFDLLESIEKVRGTSFADQLIGSASNDVLNGLGGNDKLSGKDGDDVLKGNQGDDSLTGGAGTDVCNGGPGDDTIKSCP